MTPVPPTPVTSTPKGTSVFGNAGYGSAFTSSALPGSIFVFACFLSLPPSTVTKLGQKPVTQEKSLLQEDWLIRRLRPNSVSNGSTERQFDCTEQSPQPSHTASLITARLAGSGKPGLPFLSIFFRRRRFSEAQVWS